MIPVMARNRSVYMLIDVNGLALDESLEFDFSEDMQVSNVPVKAHIKGSLVSTNEGHIAKGDINAVLSLKCDLCLDEFKVELELPFDEIYSNNGSDPEKEYRSFSDKIIDLKPAVEADILLNMPMKAVCSENCKGLCPKCGQNLNKGECGCDREYSNPVFEKLMDLFEDKG